MSERRIPPSRRTEPPREVYSWLGKSMKRVEDPRFLTGGGNYIDDFLPPNTAHAAVLRSPHAHARIAAVDTAAAAALPGVLRVMSGEEVAAVTGPLPTFASPPCEQRCVAVDRVRHVGEPVAVVAAETRYLAEDACDLIAVEYEELPAVVDPEEAVNSTGDAVLHPERGDGNIALARRFTFGPVDEDFAGADMVVRRRLRWPRSGAQPLETSGAVAEWSAGKCTIHVNSSMYNYVGWLLAATLGIEPHRLNIVPVDAGGSFGSKLFLHKVPVIAATLAREIGRPVKYLEDRLDNTTSSDNMGSDRVYDAELAVDRDGAARGLRFSCIDDYGAYFQFGVGHHGNALSQVTGPYRIRSVDMDLKAVFTNKCQQGAYRGFGSEVANFVVERMMDAAAAALELDPVEIRRRNLIGPDEFPYIIPSGNMYDSGNYPAVLEKALEMLDYDGWRRKQEELRRQGRYIGIGVATCQERSVFSSTEFWMLNHEPGFSLTSSPESVQVKIDPAGKAFVTLGAPFWGNSPETVATQVLAEQLQMSPDDIVVGYAGTDSGFNSTGPGGSRFTVMVSGALVGAARRLRSKMLRIAGHLMEADTGDLELRDGAVSIKGVPEKKMTIAEIAMQAHYFRLSLPDGEDFASGLDATCVYDHPATTMPSEDRSDMGVFYPIMGHMCHMPVVEVDVETGRIEFLKYVAVHDCGTMVNPMTLAGHVRGGTAQGIGSAVYEHFHYDDAGQLLTASYSDYLIPTVMETPDVIEVGHVETPSPFTEYGIKGGGEGGRMGAPMAVAHAVEDALEPFGVRIDELPLTPRRLRTMIREARAEG